MINLSRDTLLGGSLVLWQPAKGEGYRFNLDPVFLASFVEPCEMVVDVGAGCGILGLYLLKTGRAKRLVAVERVPEMAEIIIQNAAENGLEDVTEVICSDLRELTLDAADTVVFNPPYFRANQGRPAKNALRDAARFERYGTLDDFVQLGARLVGDAGEVVAIVPEARRAELGQCFRGQGLELSRTRQVITRPGAEPVLAILAGSRRGGRCVEAEALLIHAGEDGRTFSAEVEALVGSSG